MNDFTTMRQILLLIFLTVVFQVHSQLQPFMPYQAIARNLAGQPIANTNLNARFTMHDSLPSGEVIWQEIHPITTNATGLFNVQLGSQSSLQNINWAGNHKFMQVELNVSGTYVNMGTQQMLSAPYALHTEGISYRVSSAGDTLYLGSNEYVIVPGISAANPSGNGNGGDGGGGSAGTSSGTTAHTCGAGNVVNANLTYNSVIDQEGNIYKTIVIGNQEWMAENLNTSVYRNGDAITTGLTSSQWAATNTSAWNYFTANASYECPYGKLYNFYACIDARQLCPTGWHIPTDAEWTIMINNFGGEAFVNSSGGALKSTGTNQLGTGYWNGPNTGATNVSGFSGLPGGYIMSDGFSGNQTLNAYFWSSTESSASTAYSRILYHDPGAVARAANLSKRSGMSVRCLKD